MVSESDVSFPDRPSCLASFSEQKKALELRTEIAKAEAEGLAYAELKRVVLLVQLLAKLLSGAKIQAIMDPRRTQTGNCT